MYSRVAKKYEKSEIKQQSPSSVANILQKTISKGIFEAPLFGFGSGKEALYMVCK
jgi:hypothetical protein